MTLTLNTQRARRGHNFLAPKAVMAKIPALYATDGQGMDAIAYLHFFSSSADWYITELDPETWEAFGMADLGMGPEWGYVPLTELEAVSSHGGLVIVERDCFFDPAPMREVLAKR